MKSETQVMLCSNAFDDKLCIFSKQENWLIKYMQAILISQEDDLGIEVSIYANNLEPKGSSIYNHI